MKPTITNCRCSDEQQLLHAVSVAGTECLWCETCSGWLSPERSVQIRQQRLIEAAREVKNEDL